MADGAAAPRTRGIRFSYWSALLIPTGHKDVSRRVLRDVPPEAVRVELRDRAWHCYGPTLPGVDTEPLVTLHSHYGQPGDQLWVRERWLPDFAGHRTAYQARYSEEWLDTAGRGVKWNTARHMPRDRARLWLKVVALRAERLHAIDKADAIREGAYFDGQYFRIGIHPTKGTLQCWNDPVLGFRTAWDQINAKHAPWASNPWVQRVEFKLLREEGP